MSGCSPEPVAERAPRPRIAVVGVGVDGRPLGERERRALAEATVVAVPKRLGERVRGSVSPAATLLELSGDLRRLVERLAGHLAEGARVAVVAGGDPGFFGIGRLLAERLGREALEVFPSAPSPAVAFGRAGLPWEDATVVSAHGRPLFEAVAALSGRQKAAVLTSPEVTPERLGEALLAAGAAFEHVAVASDLATPSESFEEGDLAWLAGRPRSPLSVVLLWNGSGVAPAMTVAGVPGTSGGRRAALGFGEPESAFEHRGQMITKAEVRSFCLGRLELPASGVLVDVGAGSGSVAVEAALLSPGLRVIAVERSAEDAQRIRRNAARHGAAVEVVEAAAPECLERLPRPDRAFVGGGGLVALEGVLARLSPGGRVVATFAALDRAAAAAARLGSLVQLAASRGSRLPDGSFRLQALDPVFVCWGPDDRGEAPER